MIKGRNDVLWVSEENVPENRTFVVPYNKKKHSKKIFNFLYWKPVQWDNWENIIIVGDGNYPSGTSHLSLKKEILDSDYCLPTRFPDGAGTIYNDKISWESKEYNMETPENLRETIKIILGI